MENSTGSRNALVKSGITWSNVVKDTRRYMASLDPNE